MCGITGIINFDSEPASVTQLKQMTDAIEHRGPDSEGHFVFERMLVWAIAGYQLLI